MVTLEECKKIGTEYESLQSKALATVKDIVKERGGRIEFDWENCDAPSVVSMQFDDDLTDCHVKALHTEGDTLYGDLHAYYMGDDIDGVNLVDDEHVEWCALLQDILPYLFDEKAEE